MCDVKKEMRQINVYVFTCQQLSSIHLDNWMFGGDKYFWIDFSSSISYTTTYLTSTNFAIWRSIALAHDLTIPCT